MRTILHSDLNSCYASIELVRHPELRGRPVAVGGDESKRHGIILAKTPEAKKYGVKTGEALWQAKAKCPGLVVLPADFPLYVRYCGYARDIYSDYTDRLEGFGLDESWLDITGCPCLRGKSAFEVAGEIRERVKKELGVTVSVGVSWNKVFAKLASDMKKPDAVTVISRENYRDEAWPLPASDLLYVGPSTTAKLAGYGITTIGGIANADPDFIGGALGKAGLLLHSFANGLDASAVGLAGDEPLIKSVGNSVTPPRDLENDEDVRTVFWILCESVAERLRAHGLVCRTVEISLRDRMLRSVTRQAHISRPTNLAKELCAEAVSLFLKNRSWELPLRSVGVRALDLISADAGFQLSVFVDEERRRKLERLEISIDRLRARYGRRCVRRGITALDRAFSDMEHPVSFMPGPLLR